MERNSSALNEQLQIPQDVGRARIWKLLSGLGLAAALVGAGVLWLRPKPKTELYLVQPVTRRDIVQRIEATGRLDVRRRVEIPAPSEGRLVAIHVRDGDTVEEGQVLALLDPRAAQHAVRSAEASQLAAASTIRESEAAFGAAERALAQAKRLHERGLASTVDVQNAETELAQTRAALSAARAQERAASAGVASARLSESLGQITATRAGVVLRAPERFGAAVSPESGPLFVVGDPLELMRVDAKVGETDIALLRDGQVAQISVSALGDRTFAATVEHRGIEPELELGAVLYPVTLTVPNPERVLLPGMTARVSMEVRRSEKALAVHEAALRFVPEDAEPAPPRSRVFRRVGPAQLEPVSVRAGISDGMYTAVEPLSGQPLHVGDELAIGFARAEQGTRGPRVTLGDKK